MYYYNARYYDPFAGQFTQPDSIVADPLNPAAWNRFSYVHNAPTVLTDPSGHFAIPAGLLLVAATGFLVGEIYAGTQGYTPLNTEFWGYSLGASLLAVGGFILVADMAVAAGYGLQGVGLWTGSATLFRIGLWAEGGAAAIYAWGFQPLIFRGLPSGVSAARQTDASAIRAFGRKAEVVQSSRDQRSFSPYFWDSVAKNIEEGSTEGWFIYRRGEKSQA